MANYKTGSQRYNDRMDKIYEKAIKLRDLNETKKCPICNKNTTLECPSMHCIPL